MNIINKFDFNINSNNNVFDLFEIDDTFNNKKNNIFRIQ